MGDDLRASTNLLSKQKRRELRESGMALIFGGSVRTKRIQVHC